LHHQLQIVINPSLSCKHGKVLSWGMLVVGLLETELKFRAM